jgi:hypothetical protein
MVGVQEMKTFSAAKHNQLIQFNLCSLFRVEDKNLACHAS